LNWRFGPHIEKQTSMVEIAAHKKPRLLATRRHQLNDVGLCILLPEILDVVGEIVEALLGPDLPACTADERN
jgi:hypothetical protein